MAGPLEALRNGLFAQQPGLPSQRSDQMLSFGLGLLSGGTPQEQVAKAASNLASERGLNKTVEWFKKNDPEMAQAIAQGIINPSDAFKLAYQRKLEAQAPKKPLEVNGRLVDPQTYQVLADFSDAPKPNGVTQDVGARQQAAAALGLAPDSPAYQSYVLTGKMPREDAQTLTATDKKAMWAAEDEIPSLDNTLTSLKQAKELNRKTYSGTGAGILGTVGTNVPGAGYILDRDKAVATSEFNKLMSMEAIQAMAQSLKGATTDAELARFVEILADPSTDPDIRERTIDRMMTLAERVKEVKVNRVNELRGVTPDGIKGTRKTSSGTTWSVE